MTPHFERVCIIGVGLLGSSLGLALKKRGIAECVIGVGHRQSSLDTALERGAIDEAFLEIAPALSSSDLIVIATPANLVIPKLEICLKHCKADAVICDVASTKAEICAWATAHYNKAFSHRKIDYYELKKIRDDANRRPSNKSEFIEILMHKYGYSKKHTISLLKPTKRNFVGCHPMAGSEKFGAEHGDAELYVGHPCIVESSADIPSEVREIIKRLWEGLGAKVVEMLPEQHDQVLARTSHIPHILATAIATLAERHGASGDVIGNGFRDTTRVAAGRPEVWRDIVISNADAIHEGIGELQDYLRQFAEAVEARDAAALEQLFEKGRAARAKVVDS